MADTTIKIQLEDISGPGAGPAAVPSTNPPLPTQPQTQAQQPPANSQQTGPARSPVQGPSANAPRIQQGPSATAAGQQLASHVAQMTGLGGISSLLQQVSALVNDVGRFAKAVMQPAVQSGSRASSLLPSLPQQQQLTVPARHPAPPALPAGGSHVTGPRPIPAASAAGGAGGAGAAGAGSAAGGAASSAAGSLAPLAAAGGPVAIAFASVAAAAAGAVLAIKELGSVMGDQAKKLDGYSPEVSMAMGQADIRGEMQSFRRAQAIGPDLAKFENMKSDVEDKLYDVGTEILKVVLDMVNKFEPEIKLATGVLATVPTGIELTIKAIEAIYEAATLQWGKASASMDDIAKLQRKMEQKLSDYIRKKDDQGEEDPFIGQFFDIMNQRTAADNRPRPPVPPPPPFPPANPVGNAAAAGAAGGGP